MKYAYLPFIALLFSFFGCVETPEKTSNSTVQWTNLIDTNLSHWDQYLSYRHKNGYDGTEPQDSLGNKITPIGLNQKGYDVFTTQVMENDTVIAISGEIYGCLITKEAYRNYHLQLQYKWGDKIWEPRKQKLKDSGVLYHSIGDMGADYWRSWMLSQELQVMEGHTGDYFTQGRPELGVSLVDIRAYIPEFVIPALAHESQGYLTVGQDEEVKYYCMRKGNYEKPNDEWNTVELICYEGKSLHIVNGEVVMVLKNSRYKDPTGATFPLIEGKIQLQSEAAEIFYKDIKIIPLDTLAEKYEVYF
ncbi:MAG: DUF1080 domain-containing protein [Bacteroidota bacterium]